MISVPFQGGCKNKIHGRRPCKGLMSRLSVDAMDHDKKISCVGSLIPRSTLGRYFGRRSLNESSIMMNCHLCISCLILMSVHDTGLPLCTRLWHLVYERLGLRAPQQLRVLRGTARDLSLLISGMSSSFRYQLDT